MNLPDDAATGAILRHLIADARRSMRQLSALVGLSPPAVTERVRRLEDLGAIRGYKAVVDRAKLGWPVEAFVSLTARDGRCDLVMERIKALPNAIAAYHVAGDTDYVVRVAARDLGELKRVTDQLSEAGSVSTQVILEEVFEREPI